MITEQDCGIIEKSNIGAQSSFGIAATAHAFNILSNSLYSNKPLALIRELVCNAWDAHEDKKILDEPFDVHFPNTLEPYFSVRDYGYGISPEFMLNGYTQAFHSTKTDTNNQIGGFGLGRLSAFAYTDSYTVVSIYQGVKRSYIVFKEGGLPTITLVGEEATEERDGFQVTVSVTAKDFSSFSSAGAQFFNYLQIPVNILGREPFTKREPAITGDGWSKWSNYNGVSYVKCGLVHYAIDSTIITSPLVNASITVDMPIGSVEVAPSREALSYTEKTKAAINAKLLEIQKDLAKTFQEQLDLAPTKLDAKILYNKFAFDSAALIKLINGSLTYKGEVENGKFEIDPSVTIKKILIRYSRRNSSIHYSPIYPGYGASKAALQPFEGDMFIYNDLPDHADRRLSKLIKSRSYDSIYILPNAPSIFDDLFGRSDFPKLSEFDYDPIVKKTRAKNPLSGLKLMAWSRRTNEFTSQPFDDSKPFYYICCTKHQTKNRSDIVEKINDLTGLGFDLSDFQLIWVSPTQVSKIAVLPMATEFFKWANTSITVSVASLANSYIILQRSSEFYSLMRFAGFMENHNISSSKLQAIGELHDQLAKKECPSDHYVSLATKYNNPIKVDTSLIEATEKLLKEKPLLSVMDTSEWRVSQPRGAALLKDLQQYIES